MQVVMVVVMQVAMQAAMQAAMQGGLPVPGRERGEVCLELGKPVCGGHWQQVRDWQQQRE